MRFLIDNGHGEETPGKRSPVWPDGSRLLEWEYNRIIAKEVVNSLKSLGVMSELLVPEKNDVSLNERCRRANKIAQVVGRKNCLLVSIHVNASTGLPTAKAKGWEVHTYTGQSVSDTYATVFYNEALSVLLNDTKMRADWSDKDPDFDSNFAVLRDTICPSVLTENLFMDNVDDCKFLLSEIGKKKIVDIHVNAILKIKELC